MDFNALARTLGLPPMATGMSQLATNPITGGTGVYPSYYDAATAATGGSSDVPQNDQGLEAWPDWMLGLLVDDFKLESDPPSNQDVPQNNLGTENWSQEDLMNDPINRIVRGKLGDDYGVSYHKTMRENPQITPWPVDDSVYNLEIKQNDLPPMKRPVEAAPVAAPVVEPTSAPVKSPINPLTLGMSLLQRPKAAPLPAPPLHRPDMIPVSQLLKMYKGGLLR